MLSWQYGFIETNELGHETIEFDFELLMYNGEDNPKLAQLVSIPVVFAQ